MRFRSRRSASVCGGTGPASVEKLENVARFGFASERNKEMGNPLLAASIGLAVVLRFTKPAPTLFALRKAQGPDLRPSRPSQSSPFPHFACRRRRSRPHFLISSRPPVPSFFFFLKSFSSRLLPLRHPCVKASVIPKRHAPRTVGRAVPIASTGLIIPVKNPGDLYYPCDFLREEATL